MSSTIQELTSPRMNDSKAVCNFCKSVFLQPNVAAYIENSVDLPLMSQKKYKDDQVQKENVSQFWSVNNMYDFENMGFSNTVGNMKYLVCADCEMGPVGYYDLETKKCYVALHRVTDQ